MFVAQQLGRYHLLDRVAFGGMAEIYRAKTFDSNGNEHIVAIKRVLSHLADDDEFLQMLVDEAKIATLLDHANIAKVFEFVRWGDEYFIAMEYVDGKDLRTILDRCRSEGAWIEIEDCAYIMVRVLEALHAAHERCDGAGQPLHIVHRDVSPSNVIISYDGQVKLCDFGIAKAKMTRVQTRTGVIKGKVRYMSPEQALGRPLDRRTDLFSAGSVFYEILTKQCPFQADNEMELIFRVRDAKYPRPSKYNPKIPSAFERVLRTALARSRSARYQTATDFAADLHGYLGDHAPGYSPSKLGGFVRQLFAKDIEKEQRQLQEFVVGDANPAELGDNLLAEVLGQGAAYTQFSPVDPRALEEVREGDKTKLQPRVPVPEKRLPKQADLHDMQTVIIDQEEREKRVMKRKGRRRPGADYDRQRQRATQVGTIVAMKPELEPVGSSPQHARDPHFHGAETQIIDGHDIEGGPLAATFVDGEGQATLDRGPSQVPPRPGPVVGRAPSIRPAATDVDGAPHSDEVATGEVTPRPREQSELITLGEDEVELMEDSGPDARFSGSVGEVSVVEELSASDLEDFPSRERKIDDSCDEDADTGERSTEVDPDFSPHGDREP